MDNRARLRAERELGDFLQVRELLRARRVGRLRLQETSGVWSAPQRLPGATVTLDASCASASMCIAVGVAGVWLWDGSTWSDSTVSPAPDSPLQSVSCPTTTFCLAVSEDAETFTFDGTSWAGPFEASIGPQLVSCASPTFCMGTAGYDAMVFDGTSWGAPMTDGLPTTATGTLSCPTASFCMAIGPGDSGPGTSVVDSQWDGTAWTADPVPLPRGAVGRVDCLSATSCDDGG
jgi:hypothetical protein